MRFVLTLLLFALCVSAQVQVVYSPEPMAVLETLNVRNVGLWSVRACNDGPAAATVPEERFYIAAPGIRLIAPDRARVIVMGGYGKTKKVKAVKIISWGLLGATALTGFGPIAATPTIVAALASGSAVAMTVQRQLQGDLPDLGPFLGGLISGPVTIPAGGCITRTAFAAKMKSPQNVTAVIHP